MEAVVSSAIMENNRFQINRKTATNVLCARTLPKQWRESMAATTARHHTYPRTTPPKRTGISCSDEPSPPTCKLSTERNDRTTTPSEQSDAQHNGFNVNNNNKSNGVVKLKGSLAREVADAWEYRVGPSDQPASADRVQSIFNDIELYPTKNQVFEMLVCARECARRKSLTLTFGEFCFFAAELRRCSRQTRQTSNKSEPWSQEWTVDKEPKEKDTTCKHLNGSEASPPPWEVFLGGSCNPTTWRSDIAIPMLNRMGITYFNPQVEDWSMELVEVEHRAKAAARALLFVLDCETRAVAASVEVAHLAAAPRDLLLVLRPYTRHQTLGHEVITDQEYLELARARATLQEAVERRGLPAFTDIPAALRCAGAVLRGARTHPRHMFGHTILRLKRAFDAAGGRNARLPRSRAVDALRDVTGTARDVADHSLPPVDAVDFETFCAAVAELAADAESETRNGTNSSGESHPSPTDGAGSARARDANGLYNNRLRAYGRKLRLHIPKNGENRSSRAECSAATSTPGSSGGAGASEGAERGEGGVFTPGTERRLQRLPSMLQHKYDVYLSGTFPTNGTRPEEVVRREGLSCVAPRANDYTRMFSAPARRSAPAPPDKPRHDKKPRPSPATEDAHHRDQSEDAVQLRERSAAADPGDRLSASDFYKVSEDITPQPFKGTYDEELLLRSRILLFAMSSEAPCFCTLVLAAHYLGLRPAHTVLLIQPMQYRPDGPYSEAAVKDYNRGRHYLRDLALRANVPVFDSTDAALACVLATLRRGDV